MTKQTKIVAGVLAGAALGTAIALILSSDKSSPFREKAEDWFCDLLANSKDKLDTLGNSVKDKLAKVNV
ncbi:MAG: YtxH domain-containing protein [Pedobacter sp.]|nr:MAG: YtxH domain-containing protein [Pedobacter sp.]